MVTTYRAFAVVLIIRRDPLPLVLPHLSRGDRGMSKPFEIETAEYECLISPSAGEISRPKPASTAVRADFGAVSHTGKVRPKTRTISSSPRSAASRRSS